MKDLFGQRVYRTDIDFESAFSFLTKKSNTNDILGIKAAWPTDKGYLNLRFNLLPDVPVQLTRNSYLIIKRGSVYDDAKIVTALAFQLQKPFNYILVHHHLDSKITSALACLQFMEGANHHLSGLRIFENNLEENVPKIIPNVSKKKLEWMLAKFQMEWLAAQTQIPNRDCLFTPWDASGLKVLRKKKVMSEDEFFRLSRIHNHMYIDMLLRESLQYQLQNGLIDLL